jgi:hypothetical protein
MTWLERLEQIGIAATTSVIAAIGAAMWWFVRAVFTDRSRLSLLEREMRDRVQRHDDLRTDVTRQFDKVDEKLTRIETVLITENRK